MNLEAVNDDNLDWKLSRSLVTYVHAQMLKCRLEWWSLAWQWQTFLSVTPPPASPALNMKIIGIDVMAWQV